MDSVALDINAIAFYLLAGMSLGSAVLILLSKNVVRAVFMLVLVFVGVAGIYMVTRAEFVAVTQILVYIGGVLILLMFGIMLTNRIDGQQLVTGNKRVWPAVIAGGVFFCLLARVVIGHQSGYFDFSHAHTQENTTRQIGVNLMTNQVLALEITAVLLLVALVGAALIVGKKSEAENE